MYDFSRRETAEGFRNEFAFLSNMHSCPVIVEILGKSYTFPSAEHAFQAYKAEYAIDKVEAVKWLDKLLLVSPSESKRMGRTLAIDLAKWNEHSQTRMLAVLIAKFSQNKDLNDKLLATVGTDLIEYNNWNDTVWGVSIKTGIGENRLGTLLMNLRKLQPFSTFSKDL